MAARTRAAEEDGHSPADGTAKKKKKNGPTRDLTPLA